VERALVEAVARVRPDTPLVAVLGREQGLAEPGALEAGARSRLEVHGAGARTRTVRIATLVARAAAATMRARPGLVVCGHVHYAALARSLASLVGAKLAVLAHGIEAWTIESAAAARAVRAADRVIAVSSYTAARLSREASVAQERVAVLHNPVDTDRFCPGPASTAMEERLSELPRPRLLTVSRLDATEGYKGVDTVLRALAHGRRSASYLIVGDGSDRPRLEALARSLGVRARFYGRAPEGELVDLYRACDLFVMPSRGEGFGCVFVEALACGMPVVAGGVDGSVDALGGGRLGLLVDPFDPAAVDAAIGAHLERTAPSELRDPAWLRAEVVGRFGLERFSRRVDEILASLGA
jgi:glycosyltransferase involved in cell wall biosynthesis